MSYDLFFMADSGKGIDKKKFGAYFRGRRHYTVGKGQAVYQNEDTGVAFILDEPSEGAMAFNLNYFRPHVFGLEAAIELEAFGKAFGLNVVDPQNEGMGEDVPFTREGFLRGWNAGNRFGYSAILGDRTEPVFTWPAKKVREVWEWNYARPTEEQQEKAGAFVPGIFGVVRGKEAWSVAIWPPQCPILIPAVDAVLVPLAQEGKESQKLGLVEWKELLPAVAKFAVKGPGLRRIGWYLRNGRRRLGRFWLRSGRMR